MVKKFREASTPQAQIEALTGMSERTIRRVQAEPAVTDLDDEAFRKQRGVGRPSAVAQYEETIRAWLAEPRPGTDGPPAPTEILARLRKEGYTGGKTAVFELVRRLRPSKVQPPVVRFEGLPGEFSQHDFGSRWVEYETGSRERVHFLVSRLKYSRMIAVEIVPNERLETLVRGLLAAFAIFGGVPLKCVFDNMKTAVAGRPTDEHGNVTVLWTRQFGQFALDCDFIPIACWPYQPRQKGSVENGVGFVKGNFFTGRRFRDPEDLKAQLAEWVSEVNTRRPSDATGEIPEIRLREELPRLTPLKYTADDYPFKDSAVVRTTGRVVHAGLEYSVPGKYKGQTATLHLTARRVHVYMGLDRITSHDRFPENGKCSIHPEHAEELFVFERGRPYAKRQILLDAHPAVEPYLTALVHRRPMTWEPDVEKMYDLYREAGHRRFVDAVLEADRQGAVGAEYLRHLLVRPALDNVTTNSSDVQEVMA